MLKGLTTLGIGENGSLRLLFYFKENLWPSSTTRFIHSSFVSLKKAKRSSSSQTQPQKELQRLVMADTHYMEKQKTEVLHTFPNVKATIINMFRNLASNMDSSYRCEPKTFPIGRVNHQMVFQCSLYINWPKSTTFHGYALSKKKAELSSYTKLAETFHKEKLMTSSGHPVTVSKDDRKSILAEMNMPLPISLPADAMEEGWQLLNHYDMEIKPLLQITEPTTSKYSSFADDSEDGFLFIKEALHEDYGQEQVRDLLTGQTLNLDPGDIELRSIWLSQKLLSREHNSRTDSPALPVLKFRDSIENAFLDNRVLIVSGDTGCGKSTQVPQMILDKWIRKGRGADCNILVTQPRRISAISLANRVAQERAEKIGESVGYQVRLQQRYVKKRGGIMFCTTGMLLQNLHSNPTLMGISHIIVDEVHERSMQVDLLMILLRRVMAQHSHLRVVLMSASLSIDQLAQYFGQSGVRVLEVPGTLFPLTRHCLPDGLNMLGLNPSKYNLMPLMQQESDNCPLVNVDLVVDVIKAIHLSRPPGAVLCFLPGWQDISHVETRLNENQGMGGELWVLPLHGRLSIQDQELVFQRAPEGRRKVVLTTNIAETSLTIDDVVYVVDTGFHKEQRYNSQRDITVLGNHWISQANSQQRAGRAGRVQPGEVFHLYSSHIHDSMDKFPLPEIQKISLEHVILLSKAHCGEESVMSFLSEGLSVPHRRFISTALSMLEKLGMLHCDQHRQSETLTALGQRVIHFSTPPQLSKALVYASVFRCLDAVLSISATVSSGRGVFFNNLDVRAKTREVKMMMDPSSDLLATYRLLHECQRYQHLHDVLAFCNAHNVNLKALRFCEGIKRVYGNHLVDASLVNGRNIDWPSSPWSINSGNGQLVLGVLLAGGNNILHIQQGTYSKGFIKPNSFTIRNSQGHQISTVSDCVLHQLPPKTPPPHLLRHLLCITLIREEVSYRTVARDLSILNPLTVALFAGNYVSTKQFPMGTCISVDDKPQLSFLVDERTGVFLEKLRSVMDQIIYHEIMTRGFEETPQPVAAFIENLVQYISHLLGTTVSQMPDVESRESRGL